MISSFNRALDAHRDRINKNEKGFTLIELLIVVLIIGVLAAIAIPIYLTTQQTARDNTAKTTVTDAKTAVVAYYTQEGSLPSLTDLEESFKPSSEVDFNYIPGSGSTFCISASFGDDGQIFKTADNSSTEEATTHCS